MLIAGCAQMCISFADWLIRPAVLVFEQLSTPERPISKAGEYGGSYDRYSFRDGFRGQQ